MPDPFTHLLWGYILARSLTRRPGYLLLGMVAGVLPDLDAVLPGLEHHGWFHTPVFLCFVSLTLWGANNRDLLMLRVTVCVMTGHLLLDAIGGGLAWFWPLSTTTLSLVPIRAPVALVALRVFLLVTPAYWIWDRWRRTGEGPMTAVRWVEGFLPRPVTWSGASSFCFATVLVLTDRLLMIMQG